MSDSNPLVKKEVSSGFKKAVDDDDSGLYADPIYKKLKGMLGGGSEEKDPLSAAVKARIKAASEST